jgi:hypothetical protein
MFPYKWQEYIEFVACSNGKYTCSLPPCPPSAVPWPGHNVDSYPSKTKINEPVQKRPNIQKHVLRRSTRPHSMFQFLTIPNPLPFRAGVFLGPAEPAIRDGFNGGWMVVFKWVLIGFNRFNGFNISICISVLYIYIHTVCGFYGKW